MFYCVDLLNEQTKKRLAEAKKVLQQHMSDDQSPSKIEEYKTEIQDVATRMWTTILENCAMSMVKCCCHVKHVGEIIAGDRDALAQLYLTKQQVLAAVRLRDYLSATNESISIIMGEQLVSCIATPSYVYMTLQLTF